MGFGSFLCIVTKLLVANPRPWPETEVISQNKNALKLVPGMGAEEDTNNVNQQNE